MQNTIQFPYPFSPMTLASMFDLHHLQNHHQNNPNNNNNSSAIVGNNSSLSPSRTPDSPRENNFEAAAVAMSHFLFPQSFLNHNFPHHHQGNHHQLPYHGGGPNGQLYNPFEGNLNNHKDKFMSTNCTSGKRGGGKSFTIDSLLGLNSLTAARAALVNHHQHLNNSNNSNNNCLNLSTNNNNANGGVNGVGIGGNWRHSADTSSAINHNSHKSELIISSKKESSRFHPFSNNHHVTSKSHKIKNSAISNSSEKSQESSTLENGRRGSKAKRVRTIFTPEQLERLEAEFERQQYMVGPERLYLASSLHLTEAQCKVWFQNRRIKWRKQHLEMQQQRLAVLRAQRHGEIDEDEEDLEEDDQSQSDRSSPGPFSPPVMSMPLMITRIKEHQDQTQNNNQKTPSPTKSSSSSSGAGLTQYNTYVSPCTSSTTLSCSPPPPLQINHQQDHSSVGETLHRENNNNNMNRSQSGTPGKEKRPIIRFYSNISEENFLE